MYKVFLLIFSILIKQLIFKAITSYQISKKGITYSSIKDRKGRAILIEPI